VLDEVGADIIAEGVFVPDRPGEQVLHPIRGGIAGVLGDRPAVLARQVGQQAAHERLGPAAKIHPSEPACDPAHHLVEQLLPPGRICVYEESRYSSARLERRCMRPGAQRGRSVRR
jgi:hypothetical protein